MHHAGHLNHSRLLLTFFWPRNKPRSQTEPSWKSIKHTYAVFLVSSKSYFTRCNDIKIYLTMFNTQSGQNLDTFQSSVCSVRAHTAHDKLLELYFLHLQGWVAVGSVMLQLIKHVRVIIWTGTAARQWRQTLVSSLALVWTGASRRLVITRTLRNTFSEQGLVWSLF